MKICYVCLAEWFSGTRSNNFHSDWIIFVLHSCKRKFVFLIELLTYGFSFIVMAIMLVIQESTKWVDKNSEHHIFSKNLFCQCFTAKTSIAVIQLEYFCFDPVWWTSYSVCVWVYFNGIASRRTANRITIHSHLSFSYWCALYTYIIKNNILILLWCPTSFVFVPLLVGFVVALTLGGAALLSGYRVFWL